MVYDPKDAVQSAFIAALRVPSMTTLAPVYQHVPDDRQPPVVIIGQVTLTPMGGKDGGLDEAGVEILTLSRGAGREFLTPLMAMVRSLIAPADQAGGIALPAQAGAELSRPVFVSDDDEELPDGATYLGTQRFSLFVQPSD